MKKRISLLLALLLLLALTACKKENQPQNNETKAPVTLPAVVKPAPTAAPEASGTDEEETEPFEFDFEEADYLGTLDSQIYGRVRFLWQDNRLILLDSYSSQLCVLDAQGFTPSADEDDRLDALVGGDMNFDGYLDFRLLYSKNDLNSYYYCWFWNMDEKSFDYFSPLAVIPNPDFDAAAKKVISYNRLSARNAIVTEYVWQEDELLPTGHHEVDNGNDYYVGGPEDVDTPIGIFDGLTLSGVSLQGNVDSESRWLCRIEDETVVTLFSSEYNDFNAMHRFIFAGLRPGTTTVVLRYATDWNADYIADKALNVTVRPDMTLRIIETDR